MRDVDRDQRYVRLAKFGGDDRRDHFVGLKFDHQVHFFADQQFGIPLRGRCAVTVVYRDHFDPLGRCRVAKTFAHVF